MTHIDSEPQESGGNWWRLAAIVAAVLLIAGLGVVWIGRQHRQAYLVSGVPRAYSARINGETYVLPPQSVTPIRVHVGKVLVEVLDKDWNEPAVTVDIQAAPWNDWHSRQVDVINPDQCAVLRRMAVIQGSAHPEMVRDKGSAVGGQTLMTFEGIDYPFPEEFKPGGAVYQDKEIGRMVLDLAKDSTDLRGGMTIKYLWDELGAAAAGRLCEHRLVFEPDSLVYLSLLKVALKPEETAEFLRRHLGDRPLRVAWHLFYQFSLNALGQSDRLQREYTAMLAKEPGNKDLMYLCSQAARMDDAQTLRLLRRAADGDAPSGYACLSMCDYCLETARFHEAAAYAGKMLALLPGNKAATRVAWKAFLSDGDYDKALKAARLQQDDAPGSWYGTQLDEVYISFLRGGADKAADTIEAVTASIPYTGVNSHEVVAELLRAQVEYWSGRPGKLADLLERSGDRDYRFVGDLIAGDSKRAEADLPSPELIGTDGHLLTYIVDMKCGQNAVAQRHLQAAVDLLNKSGRGDHQYADYLLGHTPVPLDQLLAMPVRSGSMRIVLVIIGLRNPAIRQACFARARKLNFDKRPPYLALMDAMASAK